MLKMRKTRELAMQTLFLWDAQGRDDAAAARQVLDDGIQELRMRIALEHADAVNPADLDDIRRRALEMATGTWAQREQIDPWVERLAPQWPTRRQPAVDRNLIRLGVWEMTNSDTPPKVVIDEAIELAKEFSTEQSPAFVNGVLDAVLKERQALSKSSEFGVQSSGDAPAVASPPPEL
jgi:N utilization substance protein B